jgi:hypothetical protein
MSQVYSYPNLDRFSTACRVFPFHFRKLRDTVVRAGRSERKAPSSAALGWPPCRKKAVFTPRPHSRKGRKGSKERKEKTALSLIAHNATIGLCARLPMAITRHPAAPVTPPSRAGLKVKRIGGKCIGLGIRREISEGRRQKSEAQEGSLARRANYGTEQQAEDGRGRAKRELEELRKGVRGPEVLSSVSCRRSEAALPRVFSAWRGITASAPPWHARSAAAWDKTERTYSPPLRSDCGRSSMRPFWAAPGLSAHSPRS